MENNKPDFSVSYSKLSTFRRCRQQYHWKYINKLYPPGSMGQMRGQAGHAALAEWHRNSNEQKAIEVAWNVWSNAGFQDNEEWQILQDALLRYFPWSRENDDFVLKTSEQEFNIHFDVAGKEVNFNGFIDGIVEEAGQTWLLENKFLQRMDNSDKTMDFQVSMYLLACRWLNKEVRGVIYNMVRVGNTKVAEKEPAVRRRVIRNVSGLVTIQTEVLRQVEEMIAYQEGGLPYRNPTRDCSWDCSFYQPCMLMTDDGIEPTELLQKISYIRRNSND